MSDRQRLAVEMKTADELHALDAYGLGHALAEVIEATGICRRLVVPVRDRLAKAKIDLLQATSEAEIRSAKIAKITAETEVQHIRDRASSLRTVSTILQSLLKAATII